jgi:hypothetical protein
MPPSINSRAVRVIAATPSPTRSVPQQPNKQILFAFYAYHKPGGAVKGYLKKM